MRPSPDETLLALRALVFGESLWSAQTPPRLTWIFSRCDAWDAVEIYDADVSTTALIDMVRSGDPQAEIALYLRQIPMLESLARAFTALKPAVIDQDDVSQSGIVELLELARDESRDSEELPTHFYGAIRARLAEEIEQLNKPIGVPRRTANRVREALKACEGDASAAARWAEAKPGFSAATFWSAYTAMFNTPLPLPAATELGIQFTDYTSTDAFEAAEDRVLIHHLLTRGILSDREVEVLRRTYLYSGAERDSDTEIGSVLGIHSSRVSHIRSEALAVLRSELGQMQLTGEYTIGAAA